MANLALIEKLFELDDHKFRVVTIEDEPWWFVSDVEEYLGYTSGSLRSIIRGDWEKELGDGVDFRVLEGQDLESFRQIASDLKSVSNMTRRVMLLSESGIHAVTLLSRKPKGRKLRRWLADEVLPTSRVLPCLDVRKFRSLPSPFFLPRVNGRGIPSLKGGCPSLQKSEGRMSKCLETQNL